MLPSGDQSAVEPPGPIPNPEVKRRSANGSETIGLVRVGRRQVNARLLSKGVGHFFCPNAGTRQPAPKTPEHPSTRAPSTQHPAACSVQRKRRPHRMKPAANITADMICSNRLSSLAANVHKGSKQSGFCGTNQTNPDQDLEPKMVSIQGIWTFSLRI